MGNYGNICGEKYAQVRFFIGIRSEGGFHGGIFKKRITVLPAFSAGGDAFVYWIIRRTGNTDIGRIT